MSANYGNCAYETNCRNCEFRHGERQSSPRTNMPGDWPMEVVATVTFEEVEDGKTKLTVREVGIPARWENLLEWMGAAI